MKKSFKQLQEELNNTLIEIFNELCIFWKWFYVIVYFLTIFGVGSKLNEFFTHQMLSRGEEMAVSLLCIIGYYIIRIYEICRDKK